MKNEPPVFLPSREEIDLIREQPFGSDWESVWSRICDELVGYSGEGRLIRAVGFLGLPPEEKQELAAIICKEYHEEVLAKKRFLFYDYDQRDVYDYLCNRKTISRYYRRLRKELQGDKLKRRIEIENKKFRAAGQNDEVKYAHFNEDCPAEELPDTRRNLDDSVRDKIQAICSRLCGEEITIPVNGRIDQNTKYAGLQLYPRLAPSVESNSRLIDALHRSVQETIEGEPAEQIKHEHGVADARIVEQEKKHLDELYRPDKNEARRITLRKESEVRRRLFNLDLERHFYPLIAEQIMRLMGVSQAYAHKLRSLYWPRQVRKILPPQPEEKELLDSLDILNEEEDDA